MGPGHSRDGVLPARASPPRSARQGGRATWPSGAAGVLPREGLAGGSAPGTLGTRPLEPPAPLPLCNVGPLLPRARGAPGAVGCSWATCPAGQELALGLQSCPDTLTSADLCTPASFTQQGAPVISLCSVCRPMKSRPPHEVGAHPSEPGGGAEWTAGTPGLGLTCAPAPGASTLPRAAPRTPGPWARTRGGGRGLGRRRAGAARALTGRVCA